MIGDNIATAVIQRALDGSWQREQAIAANIANHETPGYKAIKVTFEDELNRAVRDIKLNEVRGGKYYEKGLVGIRNANVGVYEDNTVIERADASNVNLEAENIDLAKVQIQMQYLSRDFTDTLTRLRYAVREGR